MYLRFRKPAGSQVSVNNSVLCPSHPAGTFQPPAIFMPLPFFQGSVPAPLPVLHNWCQALGTSIQEGVENVSVACTSAPKCLWSEFVQISG